MPLSNEHISQNYRSSFDLAIHLIAQENRARGYEIEVPNPNIIELAQSVAGDETVVHLIQHRLFDAEIYEPVLNAALNAIKKELFLDVQKKRFLSLDEYNSEFLISEPHIPAVEASQILSEDEEQKLLHTLQANLSQESYTYVKCILLPQISNWLNGLQWLLNQKSTGITDLDFIKIEKRLKLMRRFYPGGKIPATSNLDGSAHLSDQQIIHCYKNIYLGIEHRFPPYFLQYDEYHRASILTRFLVEDILESNPEKILKQRDETFFILHKLQNVYRLFNYSANRALGNAYPDIIPPWLYSRTEERYWESEENRSQAIRWLVEKRLGISPERFRKTRFTRKVFAENGLSYMFNNYYNSVSKALRAAYPEMKPWELGSVPLHYWNDANSSHAIRWMMAKKGWQPEELPRLVRRRILNRKTFSEFGLATLFEKKFNKNIYNAVSAAYPGKFQPWEIGNVSSDYWNDHKNIYHASRWIARKEGFIEDDITNAVRTNKLNFTIFKKYSICTALKRLSQGRLDRLFTPYFRREYQQYLEERKLLLKLQAMIRSEKCSKHFTHYLLYGFFAPTVQKVSEEYVYRYKRMLRRVQKRKFLDHSSL